ncbi:MAG: DUF2617 family protein [Planctomycetota bacterium]|nr:DUF2617 family protein [Planctomycetota bacterium]
MGTEQQQQRVATVRLFLYDRQIHPELFTIHHDHRVVQNDYEAQIWVTGCTHVIGFFRGAQGLAEVTAGPEAELPQRGRLLDLPFRGERNHECHAVMGIRYMMGMQAETMSPAVYGRTHHELARQGAKRGLFVPFPQWMTRAPLTPFSFVDYEASATQLHVFAFHAFPDDLTILKTQSIFELA